MVKWRVKWDLNAKVCHIRYLSKKWKPIVETWFPEFSEAHYNFQKKSIWYLFCLPKHVNHKQLIAKAKSWSKNWQNFFFFLFPHNTSELSLSYSIFSLYFHALIFSIFTHLYLTRLITSIFALSPLSLFIINFSLSSPQILLNSYAITCL